MARSRSTAWLRDELILALDLYRREGRNPTPASAFELSETLRSIPIEIEKADEPGFRNSAGVYLKVANFVSIDPDAETAGMSRGGRGDVEVFGEFWADPERLATTAVAIRSNLEAITQDQAEETEDDVADAPEGAVLTRTHRVRERNRKIVARKKAEALKANGNLSCEGCKFDFAATYGERGEGFIECHHTVPVSNLKKGHRTKLSDLALLCSNCHRIVHRRQPWLDLTALQNLVQPIHPGS